MFPRLLAFVAPAHLSLRAATQRACLVCALAILVAVVAGCTRKQTAQPVEDCTLATELKPGVPGSPGHLIASERNPNGASELATHMRMMADDLRAAREALRAEASVAPLSARHRKLRCAWPTDPSDRNAAFDAMAQTYLTKLAAFDTAPAQDRRAAYTAVLAGCRSCHEQTCEGPIAVIDALALD